MPDTWSYATDAAVIVGALGTAGALLIAALTYRRSDNERRREQASKVFALPVSHRVDERDDGSWWWEAFEATITNASDLPVLRVAIALFDVTGRRVTGRVVAMLMPRSETGAIMFPRSLAGAPNFEPPPAAIPRLQLKFTDSAGIRWVREPDGTLREIDEE